MIFSLFYVSINLDKFLAFLPLVEKHFYYKIVCIFFGATSQHCEPKKISVRKTQKPQRFLGFFVPFFKVKFKRYHFPKTTFEEDLN